MTQQRQMHQGAPPPSAGDSSRRRATWSGLLQLGLLAVPVKAYAAVDTTEVTSFNQLHAGCGQRIRYEKHCPIHGKVEASAIVKGYQYAPDRYVVVDSSELEQLRPPQERLLDLERFIPAAEVDPVRYSGRSLYLAPDGGAAQRPYHVLCQAMQQRDCVAVG